eukprot:g1700.t1
MAAPVGLDQPYFYASPEYESSKPGYVWKDSTHAQGEGFYKIFDPCSSYSGSRPGFYFSKGKSGLGYYLDLGYEESARVYFEDHKDDFISSSSDEEGEEETVIDGEEETTGDGFSDTMEVKSCCPVCHDQNGITKILVREYPFFGQIVISSFECRKCGHRNNEAKPSGDIKEKGVKLELTVSCKRDLNREVVISRFTDIEIPSVGLQIPGNPQSEGRLTTLEGVLQQATVMLDAAAKRAENALSENSENSEIEKVNKLKCMVATLAMCASGNEDYLPFQVIFDDCSGVCAIENPNAPEADANCVVTAYTRSEEQDQRTCCVRAVNDDEEAKMKAQRELQEQLTKKREARIGKLLSEDDIERLYVDADENNNMDIRFPVECGVCGGKAQNRMAITNIPHFQDIMLMCLVCPHCGYKDAEVKTSGAIAKKGKRIVVTVTKENAKDMLQRDCLKSPDCHVEIPEIGLELKRGTLGGLYTTVEGLLTQSRDQLREVSQFYMGDSAPKEAKEKFEAFFNEIDLALQGELPFQMIMTDPCAGSWVYNPTHPRKDPFIETVEYERTDEENEELGLNQMYAPQYDEMGNVVEENGEEKGREFDDEGLNDVEG